MNNGLLEKHLSSPEWAEVIRLYSGLFDKQDEKEFFIIDMTENDILLATECSLSSSSEEKKIDSILLTHLNNNANTPFEDLEIVSKMILSAIKLLNFDLAKTIFETNQTSYVNGKYKNQETRILSIMKSHSSIETEKFVLYNLSNFKEQILNWVVNNDVFLTSSLKKIYIFCLKNKFYKAISILLFKGLNLSKDEIYNALGVAFEIDIAFLKKFDYDNQIVKQYFENIIKFERSDLTSKDLYLLLTVLKKANNKDIKYFKIFKSSLKYNFSDIKLKKQVVDYFGVIDKKEIIQEMVDYAYKTNELRAFGKAASWIKEYNLQEDFKYFLDKSDFKTQIQKNLTIGDVVECVITKIVSSRVFVKTSEEKRNASIYIGELTHKRISNIFNFIYKNNQLYVGQTLVAKVISIDEKFGINLSLKQL